MKSFAFFLLSALCAFSARAADPTDLYTRVGTDPTFQELIDTGVIVPGVSSSLNPVPGSTIQVNHPALERQTGVHGEIPDDIRIHTQTNPAVLRGKFSNFTRWYQEDGGVQVMRLFKDEQNIRKGAGEKGSPGRIEAFFPLFPVAPGTWSVWEGTYTIIEPVGGNIFQLFHEGGQLWAFHLRMSGSGEIFFARRRPIPGLPDRITLATDMKGKSIRFRVLANGADYQVFKKIPQVDADWQLVTTGSYVPAKDNKISFRWGIYHGSQAGKSIPNDGLIFVSGVSRTAIPATPATEPPTAPSAPPAAPAAAASS
ncbi:MAG: hypothetical protein MUE42_06570 [Opitutaceae bacterium]|jgi:hypothetical protein|nr:hypothetical protein [Opitutaceae bacterium]